MRFAGWVRVDIAEVAGVTLSGIGPAVLLVRWIEVTAGRRCIRRRAIALVMNVESVLARGEVFYLCGHLRFIAHFGEWDGGRSDRKPHPGQARIPHS